MALFLKKILLFTLVLIVLLLGLTIFVRHFFKKIATPTQFIVEASTIIVGDSHTQMSLDPSQISNSINMSIGGEAYLFTYEKLKLLLKVNPRISCVIIGCAFHNFNATFNSEHLLTEFFNNYMLIADVAKLELKNKKEYAKAIIKKNGWPDKVSLQLAFKYLLGAKKQYYPFWGYYVSGTYSIDNHEENVDSLIAAQYGLKQFSSIQVRFLDSICSLCTSKKIRTILFNAPVRGDYFYKIPVPAKNFYLKTIEALKQKYHFEVWDYSTYRLSDSCFANSTHLSYKGASVMSQLINKSIN
jgi:hypothetical protein